MIKELKKYLEGVGQLNLKDMALMAGITKVKRVKAGEYLVVEGGRNQDYVVVLSGMLRNYVSLPGGEERTMRLSHEGMFTSTPNVLEGESIATETIVALENSLIATINRDEAEKLARERPNLMLMYTVQLRTGLVEANQMIRFFTTLSPEDRYLYLRDKHPIFIQRVQLNYLASFMGISPGSLYRIRARVAKSGK